MDQSPPDSHSDKDLFNRIACVLIAVASLLVGGGVFAYLYLTAPMPEGKPETDSGRLVRVFEAKPTTHRLRIDAYGTTRASEVWTAIAEVHGRAIEVDPQFEPGELLPAQSLLVRIDPTDYDLAVTQLEAEVRAKKEQLRELDQNEANLGQIYKLQDRQQKLARSEYDREREAFRRNVVAQSTLETSETMYITALTAVQETRNKLDLIPVQRALTQASLEAVEAQLKQAGRNRSKCEIRLPAAARCVSKSVEENQYVTVSERLGTFLTLDMTEVVAMVEARKMRSLFPEGIKKLGKLDFADMGQGRSLADLVQVPVEVHWGLGDLRSVWYGRVARIGSSLDPGTRTVPVIIEVPHPYKDVQPGVRPPLMPDIFCEVTFYGATVDDVVLIPRDALRDNRVYLLRDGKLHIQPVTVLSREKEDAVISRGIESGDMVVLTDLFPASEGMPLRGEVVESPVKPREKVDFPKDLFEQPAEEKSAPLPAATSPAPEGGT